jgi:hypothetical protein
MKALLICPAERPDVSALAEAAPLVNLHILGNPFIFYWIEQMANCGAKEIKILAADRPEEVRALVGDGARWGLRVEVIPESHELTCKQAREKYFVEDIASELSQSPNVTLMDHLPGFPNHKIFASYADYLSALRLWLSQKAGSTQIGMREIKPGIWIGLRTQISSGAVLRAPCWIGENVLVKPDAEIGPMAIVENCCVIETAASVSESWIARQTFVGNLTQVEYSLAAGNLLVNCPNNSVVAVTDTFLLSGIKDKFVFVPSGNLFGRFAALLVLILTAPFALITILRAKWLGHRALRPRRATVPTFAAQNSTSIIYYEFANTQSWWRRWPQLWNVARGDFTWIGNRPLTHIESGKLSNEFERLWLAAPIGLISQGDAEGCANLYSDEARAHASFYATQANWILDFKIFFRALVRLLTLQNTASIGSDDNEIKGRSYSLAAR